MAREKQFVTFKGNSIKLLADFSAETLQAIGEWHNMFKVLKGKNFQQDSDQQGYYSELKGAPHTKVNSKWIQNLNVRQETTKILEENTGSDLFDLSHRKFLLDMCSGTRETKAKVNYCDFIKVKIFCTEKATINNTKKQPKEWEKIFVNDVG